MKPIKNEVIPIANATILAELLPRLVNKGVFTREEVHDLLEVCAARNEEAAQTTTTEANTEAARYIRTLQDTLTV